jgi:hypothetical protein
MNQHVQIKLAKTQINGVLEALAHHLSGDDEELKLDMLEGSTDLNEIVSALLAANEDDEGTIASLDTQIDSRASRQQRLEARIEARKKAIASLMDCASITKLPLPEATLSLRTLQPRPKVVSADELPDAFVTVQSVRKPNLDAIKDAVESGETIPGVVMTNGGSSLTVRRK